METTAAKLSALRWVGAQACTTIMGATMAGIITMIRIGRFAFPAAARVVLLAAWLPRAPARVHARVLCVRIR